MSRVEECLQEVAEPLTVVLKLINNNIINIEVKSKTAILLIRIMRMMMGVGQTQILDHVYLQ